MSANGKETIYVDIDDDITGIIDKVRSSQEKIVALVLPKRANVLQSIVNMKLLKHTADDAKKRIVLITSEASLLPLAGAVGMHVAKTLQSKPVIPDPPQMQNSMISVNEDETEVIDDGIDPNKPIGELAGLPSNEEETIEVGDDDEPVKPAAAGAMGAVSATKQAINKKLKIPNFDKFRIRLALGGVGLILVIFGWYAAFYIMPKAKVILKTDTQSATINNTFTADPKAKELDETKLIVPATLKELKKTDSQKVATSGQKDMGTKATGSVTLSLNDCAQPQVTIPAGTTVSAANLNFLTQADVILKSVKIGNSCQNSSFKDFSTASVKVAAQNAGDQYNLSARAYNVSGFSNVTGQGSNMSGGTSKVVKVVSQQDVDGAKQKIIEQTGATVKTDATDELKHEGYVPILDTFTAGNPLITSSPNVGDEASEVTVNATVTYTMLGVKEDGLKKLIENDAKKQIDTSKQTVTDNGIEKAVYRILDKKQNGEMKLSLQTVVVAGPQLDANAIKAEVAGKKRGDAVSSLRSRPGIKDAEIQYSPFWVYSTPKNADKITVTFEQNNTNNGNK
ncbi:MAG: hypothetical protein JWL85_451 [Candidatus Saccharibacteria bacterium]|nr:hypothetical protein [Candidatus Saccharibacteria bacterium]